ncbi:MAG TPA: thiamine pyrophosphate-binding protein [Sphingobium sp.]|nr:thiamine pyrophosphate-binding protein [Sphingobium sp.]
MSIMKVHAAIARALSDNGVETLFGLIGDANLYMVDSFVRDCGGRFISSANEAGATLMGLGYTNVSDRLGVVSVTHGAAVTNTLTALVHGVKARVPLLLLCGDTAVEDRENFQNTGQRDHILATGAGFEQLRSPRTIGEDVATCVRRALTERRPIALNIPVEFQWLDADYEARPYRASNTRLLVPESEDLDNAIGIIAAARRPVILAGRGAIDAEARSALIRLAERIEAPLATTLQAKDLFRGEAFDLGICGTLSQPVAVDALIEADCIIAFGASLNPYTLSHGAFSKGKRFVQVDADPAQIGRYLTPDAGVVGDAARTADLFLKWLNEAEIPASGARDAALADRLATASPWEGFSTPDPSERVDMPRIIQRLEQVFPQDRVLVTDGGRFLTEPWKNLRVPDPQQFLITLAFGSIGLGMGHAIGAALARPDAPILHVTGDGGFVLGGLAEFNTAVRHKLDIVTVICNDGAYGAEHIQFRNKNMDPALSMFDWPDFAKVADALGGQGFTVETFADLERALAAIETRDRPILIDLKLDPDDMPPLP